MSIQLANHLQALIKLEKKATEFGFEWPDYESIIAQIISECAEIKQALVEQESAERVQEEIGDLLHAAISLCLFQGFDLEETLEKLQLKMKKRLDALFLVTHEEGLANLKNQSDKYKLNLWDKAKLLTK